MEVYTLLEEVTAPKKGKQLASYAEKKVIACREGRDIYVLKGIYRGPEMERELSDEEVLEVINHNLKLNNERGKYRVIFPEREHLAAALDQYRALSKKSAKYALAAGLGSAAALSLFFPPHLTAFFSTGIAAVSFLHGLYRSEKRALEEVKRAKAEKVYELVVDGYNSPI